MASKIEWTEETWNPVVGCSIVSPGCTNCYAMKMAGRLEAMGTAPHYAGTTRKTKAGSVWTGKVAMAPDSVLYAPLKRRKPAVYFVNSMGDLFHEDVTDEMIDQVFAVMAMTPHHTYQVLTKRADRMRQYLRTGRSRKLAEFMTRTLIEQAPDAPARGRSTRIEWPVISQPRSDLLGDVDRVVMKRWPLPNVWLGVSAEDQDRWNARVPELLWTPAAVRFVSVEPMLGPIDPGPIDCEGGDFTVDPLYWDTECTGSDGEDFDDVPPLDWVIVGGESGKSARPMHPDWAREIRDACAQAGVAFFFKQWGEWKEAFHDEDGPKVEHVETCTPEAESFSDLVPTARRGFLHLDGRLFRGHPDNIPVGLWRLIERVGKKTAGRRLDGVEHNGMPEVARG